MLSRIDLLRWYAESGLRLFEKPVSVFDLETLALHPRAGVVSAGLVAIGNINEQWDQIQQIERDEQFAELSCPFTYVEFGEHSRRMASLKKVVASKETLNWWQGLPKEAQRALDATPTPEEVSDSICAISEGLKDSHLIYIMHPHFDYPIWEHWCEVHVLPDGLNHRAAKDLSTIFDDFPSERMNPRIKHHALHDCLAMGAQLELAMIHRAYSRSLILQR